MSFADPDDEFANLLGPNFEYVNPKLLVEAGDQDNQSLVLKFQGGFSLEYRETPILANGEPNDVLVRVNFTAISGCDVSPLWTSVICHCLLMPNGPDCPLERRNLYHGPLHGAWA